MIGKVHWRWEKKSVDVGSLNIAAKGALENRFSVRVNTYTALNDWYMSAQCAWRLVKPSGKVVRILKYRSRFFFERSTSFLFNTR